MSGRQQLAVIFRAREGNTRGGASSPLLFSPHARVLKISPFGPKIPASATQAIQ